MFDAHFVDIFAEGNVNLFKWLEICGFTARISPTSSSQFLTGSASLIHCSVAFLRALGIS
jgi:hypothetical protein